MPERLEPALAREQHHIVGLGALEDRAEPAPERLGPAVHRMLAELVDALALLEDEDAFGPEMDLHGSRTPR